MTEGRGGDGMWAGVFELTREKREALDSWNLEGHRR